MKDLWYIIPIIYAFIINFLHGKLYSDSKEILFYSLIMGEIEHNRK